MCNSFLCVDSCPFWIVTLATIGIIFSYILLVFTAKKIIHEIKVKDVDNEIEWTMAILFPFFIVVGIFYWLIEIIISPFTSVKKEDLNRVERNLTEKINNLSRVKDIRFKKGDIVTGIKSNPDKYKHLTNGSKLKVVDINDKGLMKLVLLSHKQKGHDEVIGNTFTAPSRNFVLYK